MVGFGSGQTPTPLITGNGAVNIFSSTSSDWGGWWPNRDVYGISFGIGAGVGTGAFDLSVSIGAIRTNYSVDHELSPYKYRDKMAQDISNGINVPTKPSWFPGVIDYVTGYRSLAASVAKTASPDAEWARWK